MRVFLLSSPFSNVFGKIFIHKHTLIPYIIIFKVLHWLQWTQNNEFRMLWDQKRDILAFYCFALISFSFSLCFIIAEMRSLCTLQFWTPYLPFNWSEIFSLNISSSKWNQDEKMCRIFILLLLKNTQLRTFDVVSFLRRWCFWMGKKRNFSFSFHVSTMYL